MTRCRGEKVGDGEATRGHLLDEAWRAAVRVAIDMPAAWCLAPLQQIDWITDTDTDTDIDDDPPRYDKPLKGGWAAVSDAVMFAYEAIEREDLDVLTRVFEIEVNIAMTRPQEAIVYTWFAESVAAQWAPGETSWLNGRHRTWALKQAGFAHAPVLTMPVGDAIHGWEEDDWGPGPLDPEGILSQRAYLEWWNESARGEPWRVANPGYASRWLEIVERWELRLLTV